MKKIFILVSSMLFITACTPGIGIGIPLGPVGFVGVSADKHGVHPSAGVRAGPVGVGISG